MTGRVMFVALLAVAASRRGVACSPRGDPSPPGVPAGAAPAPDVPGWPRIGGPVEALSAGKGRVFVASAQRGAPVVIEAYADDGSLLWQRRWTGTRPRDVGRRGLAAAPDGGVFVAFGTCDGPTPVERCAEPLDVGGERIPEAAIVRLTPDGRVAWWHDRGDVRDGAALAAAADGRVAVASPSARFQILGAAGPVEVEDVAVLACEPAFLPDGGVVVTRIASGGARGARLVKLDRTGGVVWDADTQAWSPPIAASPDGAVVAVYARDLEIHSGADGTTVAHAPVLVGSALAVDGSGAVIVAGEDAPSRATAVARFAPDGTFLAGRILVPRDRGPTATAVAIRSDGSVLVGGGSPFGPTSIAGIGVAVDGGFVATLGPNLEARFGVAGPTPAPDPARWVEAGAVALPGGEPVGAIVPDRAGGAFVAGAADSDGIGFALELRHVGGDGGTVWSRKFPGFFDRIAGPVAATADGGVLVVIQYVCGISKPICDRLLPDLGGGPIAHDALVRLGPDGGFVSQVELPARETASLAVGPRGETAHVVNGALVVREPDGTVRWTTAPDGGDRVSGTPAFGASGEVYAVRWQPGAGQAVTAWSADGTLRWTSAPVHSDPAYVGRTLAVLEDGLVVASWADGSLVALDPATGADAWRRAPDDALAEPHVVLAARGGGALLVGSARDGCRDVVAARLDGAGRVSAMRPLSGHATCVGAPMLDAAAVAADGALLVAGRPFAAAELGGAPLARGEPFLASTPPP